MRKNVLVFGLLSGLVITAMMLAAANSMYNNPAFKGNMMLGYAAMLAAFSFVFVGIRNYRNKYSGGFITFGKAFRTGLYISLIASTMYVAAWLVDYYVFIPDFIDRYIAHMLNNTRESGATAAELTAKTHEMAQFKDWYKNPLFVILITYSEVLPVGLVVALLSALLLKRRPRNRGTA